MATLQKFKLFATQCGVAQSPTRSPRTSPVVHLRRRKTTLRMLLTRSSSRRSPLRDPPPMIQRKRDTLKDLFVSASPKNEEGRDGEIGRGKYEVYRMKVNGLGVGAPGSPRPAWLGFRHRVLLRKAYRPMLVGIPEDDETE